MAKFDHLKAFGEHYGRIDKYARMLDEIFRKANEEAARIAMRVDLSEDKIFSFSDYPALKESTDKLLAKLRSDMQTLILNGETAEWDYSSLKNDELVKAVFGSKSNFRKTRYERYFNHNNKARDEFYRRKVNGMNLSNRVWNLTDQHKQELELAIDIGLGDGRSAAELSSDIRKYLNEPDKLFRRVRDKYGELELSKKAKAYNPGQGNYRSSYKNAQRLARTEINMAYRSADMKRWEQLDFIVGYEVCRSQNKYSCPVCAELAGKYPKDFVFVGWHPQCRCFVVPVLKTEKEMMDDNERILSGGVPSEASESAVDDVPEGFKAWIKDNQERIEKATNPPYFIRDNKEFVKPLFKQNHKQEIFVLKFFDKTESQVKSSHYWEYANKKNITPAEALIINQYTELYYREINESLRDRPVLFDHEKMCVDVMNRGLGKLKKFEGLVYRGNSLTKGQLQIYKDALKNDIPVIEKAFISSSVDFGASVNFMDNVRFEIKSRNGRILNDISFYSKDEAEVLFMNNTRFKVSEIVSEKIGSGRVIKITMEEL